MHWIILYRKVVCISPPSFCVRKFCLGFYCDSLRGRGLARRLQEGERVSVLDFGSYGPVTGGRHSLRQGRDEEAPKRGCPVRVNSVEVRHLRRRNQAPSPRERNYFGIRPLPSVRHEGTYARFCKRIYSFQKYFFLFRASPSRWACFRSHTGPSQTLTLTLPTPTRCTRTTWGRT